MEIIESKLSQTLDRLISYLSMCIEQSKLHAGYVFRKGSSEKVLTLQSVYVRIESVSVLGLHGHVQLQYIDAFASHMSRYLNTIVISESCFISCNEN